MHISDELCGLLNAEGLVQLEEFEVARVCSVQIQNPLPFSLSV
jgi:hypothetical protein